MSDRVSAALLTSPARIAAAQIVASHLEATERAAARLEVSEDRDALHDFRVALRRLRSAMRAYRPWLGRAASHKTRIRLRELGGTTNRGRDAEVQAAWIRQAGKHLPSAARKGTGRLLQALRRRRTTHLRELRDAFTEIAAKTRKRLDSAIDRGNEIEMQAFATVYATLLELHVNDAATRLAAIRRADQVEEAHEARIAVKRLRYLLEPIVGEVADAGGILTALESLQDLLGELHDAHVLEEDLAEAQARSEAPMRALTALDARNRERRYRCYAALETDWLSGRRESFFEHAKRLVVAP